MMIQLRKIEIKLVYRLKYFNAGFLFHTREVTLSKLGIMILIHSCCPCLDTKHVSNNKS